MISVFQAPDKNGRDAIAVVLSQDSIFLAVDGEPYPSVALYPPQAREVAYRLLLFAQEIENGRKREPVPPRFQSQDLNRENGDRD